MILRDGSAATRLCRYGAGDGGETLQVRTSRSERSLSEIIVWRFTASPTAQAEPDVRPQGRPLAWHHSRADGMKRQGDGSKGIRSQCKLVRISHHIGQIRFLSRHKTTVTPSGPSA